VKDEHLPANLFGDYNLGGYLTWRAGPEYLDYFDGRFIPFGRDLFIRHSTLVSLPLDSPEWGSESSLRNIQTTIFSMARFGGLGNFPLQADCQSQNWTPVYMDDVAIVFVRNSPENASLVKRLAIRCETAPIPPNSTALQGSSWHASAERFQYLMNAASIEYVLSRDSEAADALTQAESIFGDDPNEHLLKAQLAEAHNQAGVAEQEYLTAIHLRPTDNAWFALASLYAAQHRYSDATEAVIESARLSQKSYDRYRSLGKLYLAMNEPQEALAAFAEATSKSPFHGDMAAMGTEFDARIAEGDSSAYRQMGDENRAITAQQEAVLLTPNSAARWQVLADIYQASGRPDLAAEARAKAVALQTPATVVAGAKLSPRP
jgi:tetratricopeptide (TPR) repeat protein